MRRLTQPLGVVPSEVVSIMNPSLVGNLILGGTLVVPGILILVIATWLNGRRMRRHRR